MAALRIFARSRLSTILRATNAVEVIATNPLGVLQVQKRWGNFTSSPKYIDPSHYTDYEVSKDPKEWEFVQRVLKPKVVPVPPLENTDLPSGWKPPTAKPTDNPYYVQRTRNYMHPVYLLIKFRGMRKITKIGKIHGDIWALESELKAYVKKNTGLPVGVRTNELTGEIKLRGDFVSLVQKWLGEKGF